MVITKYQTLLAVVMIGTGSINTLSTKWADMLQAADADGKIRKFNHPYVQSCTMFLGEILCLLTFKLLLSFYSNRHVIVADLQLVRGNQNFNPLIFFPAAMLDMLGTSLMYVGLTLTNAASFQMLRGSIIVFVALLSMIFLQRIIKRTQWLGIVCILMGLVTVGLSDMLTSEENTDTNGVITGDLIIIIAQIITACQMVYEEKYVVDKDIPPLQAVGWEGTFGFAVLGLLLVPFYFIHIPAPFSRNSRGVVEDLPEALIQMSNNYWIIVSMLGTMVSIAFFNFAGISVTKETSATTRMVLDSVRTFFIWMFSMVFFQQRFHTLQLAGFLILLLGMAFYYNLFSEIRVFGSSYRQRVEEPIINQQADQP